MYVHAFECKHTCLFDTQSISQSISMPIYIYVFMNVFIYGCM